MNGSVLGQTVFDQINLTVDPATLDAALGKRKVQAIDLDGSLTYDDGKTTSDNLTEQLERVWNEYPNGLLDIKEEKLERLPPNDEAIQKIDEPTEKGKERDPFKTMSRGDMDQLRSEVHEQLNSARNELWFVLELAKTLAVSSTFTAQPPIAHNQPSETASKKAKAKAAQKATEAETKVSLSASITQEPPILPPGTFSTTPSARPQKTAHAQVHDLELVLAAKQQALDECSALIDSAVSELQMMATAGDRFWRDIRKLKEGENGKKQWAVIAKPDFGRTMSTEEKAKDIIIPYATDEAPRSTRSRCLAAFDLDPTKEDALTFGSRSHLRLRTTLKDVSGIVVGSTPITPSDRLDVRAQMEAAQLEAFDEDLFGELRYELSQMSKSVMEPRSLSLPVAEYTLSFELYDTRSASRTPASPLCDLLVSSARLGLINLHKHRKARLVYPISNDRTVPSILKPIIHALRYRNLCNSVTTTLTNFADLLKAGGLENTFEDQIGTGETLATMISDYLNGESDVTTMSTSYRIDVAGCPGVKIDTFAPFRTAVTLTNATFDLSNPAEFPHILSEEFASQLLHLVHAELRDRLSSRTVSIRPVVFLDELESTILISGLGRLRITIPPPFHNIWCNVDLDTASKTTISTYDARRDGSIHTWIDGLADRLSASQ
uniref:Mediator of RNA polymerase II transcription subunit 17 n=1 Tax=Kwoniella dejecticola CBS 10117 TaxID=1296121 RepID=A0A1A6AE56_9TREE|nr:uncharacterized protein I303_00170 [Kwoniella dejecticola CBS 10117]OBR88357.1 hypothetical protein I303_00170 [Kwoniella dejecticola CBS 10117]